MIAAKVRQIDQNHVERINQISDTNNHDIVSPLEGMTLQNPIIFKVGQVLVHEL
jgi:hypothetical protein